MPTKKRRTGKRSRPKAQRKAGTGSQLFSLVIVTGMSGSGKTLVLKTLEDLGYYCVDNLPIALIPDLADLYIKTGEEINRAALGIDSREGEAIKKLPGLYRRLQRDLRTALVFVEATDEVLQRRFSETRRPHPLGADPSLRESIRRERRLLRPIRGLSDLVVDTTQYTPHDLRRLIEERFTRRNEGRPLSLQVVSFGYRYGVPSDADLVFDVRFLPNPHFVPAYRNRTGKDSRVVQYIFGFAQTREFLDRVSDLLVFLLPYYLREGKSYLTIGIGCTGGRHRSVAMAEAVRQRLADAGHSVRVHHRDVGKGA